MTALKHFSRSVIAHRLAALLLALPLALVGCASSDEKPPEPTKLVDIKQPAFTPDEVWTSRAGAGSNGVSRGFRIALHQGQLFLADAKGQVTALRADTGRRLWRVDTKLRLAAGPGLSGDLLLLGTLDGDLVALSRQDGKTLWSVPLSGEVLAPPMGNGQVLIARTLDGRSYGFSQDGKRLWVVERNVPTLTLRGISAPVLDGDRAWLGLDNGKILCVDIASGEVKWESVVSLPQGRSELERIVDIDSEPVLKDGQLYAVSYGGESVALGALTGESLWKQTVASATGVAVNNSAVYVTDPDGRVQALDIKTGAVLWKQEALLYRPLSRPILHGGYVAIGDFEGYVHWLDPRSGKIVARTRPFRQAIVAPMQIQGERLLVLGDEGSVAAIDFPRKK